ncbi:hypothetical protein LSAT2_028253 [Lamellibrachia satsuma]|nr:hypothetical protein LSAT2_028253 [Lamellibrachia satsuma]
MDSLNMSSWNNNSGLLQDLLNDSARLTTKVDIKILFIPSVPLFLVTVLGLPGNLFVIVVYIRNMTTSTKVYMFGLAIADTAVCICGTVLTSARIDHTMLVVVLYFVDLSIVSSIYLLAFVSLERLVAVWRPHSFSLSARRALVALAIIGVAAATSAGVLTFARLRHYSYLARIFPMLVTLLSVLVMIVCYMLVAIKLLRNLRAAHKNVGVLSGPQSLAPGPSTASHRAAGKSDGTVEVNKVPANQAKTYKGVSLLFIVTVVFIACWLPQWLAYVGISVSAGVRRVFLLNSAVNPFIYSAASAMFRNDVRQFYHKTRSTLTACCR